MSPELEKRLYSEFPLLYRMRHLKNPDMWRLKGHPLQRRLVHGVMKFYTLRKIFLWPMPVHRFLIIQLIELYLFFVLWRGLCLIPS